MTEPDGACPSRKQRPLTSTHSPARRNVEVPVKTTPPGV